MIVIVIYYATIVILRCISPWSNMEGEVFYLNYLLSYLLLIIQVFL